MVTAVRRLAAAIAITALLAGAAAAATYRFSVPREVVTVAVNADSSVWIDYQLTFTNSHAGDAIDVVDVGFPSDDYDLSSVVAEIDGVRLPDVRKSEYIDIGVEVHLSGHEIMPGKTGTLHVFGLNHRMVYEDDDDEAYASCVFSPTWFGSDFTEGSTHLTMVFIFPPGVNGEQSRYHNDHGGQPTQSYIQDGRVYYVWENVGASPSTQYYYGVSFPRTAVSEVRSKPRFTWLTNLFSGILYVVTHYCLCIIPIAVVILLWVVGAANRRRRMMKYLPPKAKVEGVGIKRGLTAPEAALIMELPLNRVMTLIMYGLIKRGALSVISQNPLKLKKQPTPANGYRPYEKSFLEAIEDDGDLKEINLRKMISAMISAIEDKMKGFSHRETVAYYRSIIDTAWKMVETASTPEVKVEEFSNSLEWAMMDEKFDERTRDIFSGYTVPVPYWWHYATPPAAAPAAGAGGGLTVPSLPGASFASSVVGQVEGFAHNIVSKVESFTGSVTTVTNPPPVSTSSGGGGGGGSHSSCACACACAGCACACAGGGR